jgi:PAS domain S-box-containing protein
MAENRLVAHSHLEAGSKHSFSILGTQQACKKKISAIHHDASAAPATDIIWNWDFTNNRIFYNQTIRDVLGYEISEVKHTETWQKKNIHPDDYDRVCNAVKEVCRKQQRNYHITYRFKCADDSYKFIYDRWLTIFDKNGRPERITGVMQDVTGEREQGADAHLAKMLMETKQEERQQIGLELHDNVNQILTGCLLNLAMVKYASPERTAELVETSRGYVLTAIDELRKLTHRLAPATQDTCNMKVLFENLIQSMNINRQFKVKVFIEQLKEGWIENDIQLNLYRMLQEQLTNIVKYSKATAVDVSVTIKGQYIKMRIHDNGRGFNSHLVRMGIGLNNIKKRIQLLNGVFLLNTSEGNGCELMAEIPLDRQLAQA